MAEAPTGTDRFFGVATQSPERVMMRLTEGIPVEIAV